MEVGAISVMLYCFRERELLLDINERIAGFRMFPSYIRVGGLRDDLPRGFHEAVTQFLDTFPTKLNEYEGLLTRNEIYVKRTRGVGKLSKDECIGLSLAGPIGRASGWNYDVRKIFPYSGYDTFDFDVPVGSGVPGRVLDEVLDALGVVDSRKLHEDPIGALARDQRLGDAELVHAVSDRLEGLRDGVVFHLPARRVLQREGPLPAGGAVVPLGQEALDRLLELRLVRLRRDRDRKRRVGR